MRIVGDRLAVDGLVVDDQAAVRVVRDRERAGDDPARTVVDAIEIGARVLDREQTGANAEFVKTEFEKVSREVETAFTDKARTVAEHFGTKVDEVFDPEGGHLARSLEELFSDGSSKAVQHRVRELVAEVMQRSREDLLRQFSAADGNNPLAEFKAATVRTIREAGERQDATQRAVMERMAQLESQLQALRLEKEKLEELDEERERGTAKGRTFEEQVADAVDAIACAQGDCAEAVGDLKGATRKVGDVVVEIGAAEGPALGRLVVEAKDRRLSKPRALAELDDAMRERDADYALLVVPSDQELPARMQELREYNGDKLIVTLDHGEGSTLPLELGYRLARARVLMKSASADGVDAGAVRASVERALAAMDDARKVKSQLTGAVTSIERARGIVDGMEGQVRRHLAEVDSVLLAGEDAAGGQGALDV